MYMNDIDQQAAVREQVIIHLKNLGLPCDKKIKSGKIKGYKSVKSSILQEEIDVLFPVPKIFFELCKFILAHAETEGIFRLAGSKSKQKQLKKIISKNKSWQDEGFDVIDAAAVLKHYIRELPVPLIPPAYHDLFIACQTTRNREETLLFATLLLPIENIHLLSYLMIFLNQVTSFSRYNKMTSYNLAVCIAPNILPLQGPSAELSVKINEIVQILIDCSEQIGIVPRQFQVQKKVVKTTEKPNALKKFCKLMFC